MHCKNFWSKPKKIFKTYLFILLVISVVIEIEIEQIIWYKLKREFVLHHKGEIVRFKRSSEFANCNTFL